MGTGYKATTSGEYDTLMRQAFAADPNGFDVEQGRGDVLDVVFSIFADRLGKLGEELQVIDGAWDPDIAVGVDLDRIGALRGIPRNEATASTSTVTLTGTVGTVITQGHLLEGGGVSDTARWVLSADVTIPAGGTVGGEYEAQEAGATAATTGQIDSIVTPVVGLTSATNAADAVLGQDRETDAEYRLRQTQSQNQAGSTNAEAIRAELLDLDFVVAAIVVENDTAAIVVTGGLTLDPHSIFVVIDPGSLTTAQQQSVAAVIYADMASGIATNGTGNVVVVTGGDGLAKTIRWDDVADLPVTLVVTVVLDTGFVIGDVTVAVQDAIAAYFAGVQVGEEIADSDLIAGRSGEQATTSIMAVTGIKRVASVTLNGGSIVTPNLDEKPSVNGTPTVQL